MKNETLTDNIKKTNYYIFFTKLKFEKKENIKINNDKGKLRIIKNLNLSPLVLSFEPDEKNKKNDSFNKIEKKSIHNNIFKNKLSAKIKSLDQKRLKLIKKKLSLNRVITNNTNNTFEYYKEDKSNDILNKINQNKINLFIEHKKIDFSNEKNLSSNKMKKIENKSSYIDFENSVKFKTIFTKFNNNKVNNFVPEEKSHYFEVFSSKYNNKKKEEEIKNNLNNKNKLFTNEEISRVEFYKFGSYNVKKNKKYFETETISNLNNILLENKNNKIFTKTENSKISNNSFKPIFDTKKNQRINIKFMMQKIKNNPKNIPIFNKLLNKKEELSTSNDFQNNNKYYKNSNGVKYSPINLNMLAKIPNRIIPIDSHGYEYKTFKLNNNELLRNKNKYSNSLKQNFWDIKLLRKQFLDKYHSNNITRNNSKKYFNNDNKTIQNNKYKTFYRPHDNNLNDIENLDINNNNDFIKNKQVLFLSGKKNRKKRFLELKKSNMIQIHLISI